MLTRITALFAAHPRWTALIAGGVSATGFAPLGLWPLTLIALALLLWLLEQVGTDSRVGLPTGKARQEHRVGLWTGKVKGKHHVGLPTGTVKGKRRAFTLGYLWGVGHFAISLHWIATAFTFQAAMPAWLGWVAVALGSLYLAVFPGLATLAAWWGASRLVPLRNGEGDHAQHGGVAQASGFSDQAANPLDGAPPPPPLAAVPLPVPGRTPNRLPLLLLFAAAWIITEWLRSWVFTGFAWNPLAAIWGNQLLAPPMLPVFGTYGASGYWILVAGFPLWIVEKRNDLNFQLKAVFGWLLIGFGPIVIDELSETAIDQSGTSTPVTIVQPNIEQGDKWDMAARAENFRKLARLSPRRAGASPRLLLWPEAAVPDYLEGGYPQEWYVEPASFTRARLASLLGPNDLLLTGAVRLEPNAARTDVLGARNSLFVLTAQGQLGPRYDKAHLVPFGEYLPLRSVLAPLGLSRLAAGAVDFWPGPGARTLDLSEQGFGEVGIQICYEIIFSGQVVDRANRPDFIFNPSNDAWFGSWGPPQHLAQARLRAIEEGLPVVRSTPTGISAIIDADGRIVESIPQGVAGRIDARLPLPHAATLFARYGNILPLLLAVFLGGCAIAFARRRR